MDITINNKSSYDLSEVEQVISDFYPYAEKRLKIDQPISVNLISDLENAKDPFGKTAYYDPNKMEITLFVDKRHVKDILRSFAHELVHHGQNCRGEFDKTSPTEAGYAQKDPHLRKMEAEAYLLGNGFLVRDYEDSKKENKFMNEQRLKTLKSTIREALQAALSEAEAKPDYIDIDRDGDKEESMKQAAQDKKKKGGKKDEESMEEASTKDTPDRVAGREPGRRLRPLEEDEVTEEEVVEEDTSALEEDSIEEGLDHPGQSCDEAHKGKSHDEYQQEERVGVNENTALNKDDLLFERLIKKWTK